MQPQPLLIDTENFENFEIAGMDVLAARRPPAGKKFQGMRENIAKISPYPAFEFQFLWTLRVQLLEFKRV